VVVDDPDAVPSSAEKVNDPSLEEAYLAFMAARGKLSTARQIEEELDAKAKKKQERMKLKKLR